VPDDVTIEYTKGEEEEDDEDAHSLSAWECLKAGRLKNITQRVVSSPAGGLAGVCFTSKLVSITRGEHIAWELLAQDGASLTLIGPCVALGYHFSRVRGRHCSLFYSPDATEQFKASLSRCGETWTSGMRRRGFRHIPAPADRTRLQA